MEEFKGNSFASRREEAKEQEQTATQYPAVTVKKQSDVFGFAKSIISDDASTVGSRVRDEVVIPGLKRLISDGLKTAVDYLFLGGKSSGRPSTMSSTPYVSYGSYYNRPAVQSASQQPLQKTNNFVIDDILFEEMGEAQVQLQMLKDAIGRYGMVSCGDFYDHIGVKCPFTAQKYGWRDLSTAQVVRRGGKYAIDFPKPSPLE